MKSIWNFIFESIQTALEDKIIVVIWVENPSLIKFLCSELENQFGLELTAPLHEQRWNMKINV